MVAAGVQSGLLLPVAVDGLMQAGTAADSSEHGQAHPGRMILGNLLTQCLSSFQAELTPFMQAYQTSSCIIHAVFQLFLFPTMTFEALC